MLVSTHDSTVAMYIEWSLPRPTRKAGKSLGENIYALTFRHIVTSLTFLAVDFDSVHICCQVNNFGQCRKYGGKEL